MKSKALTPNPTFEEGRDEVIDPKTGRDPSDITPGGVETMPVIDMVAPDVSHEGDVGRMNA